MEKHVFEYDQNGRKIIVEIGEVAQQANGACMVRYNDTAVLSAAVASKGKLDTDFFPLTVLYQERLYAGGKIPGGFLKREGRPTEQETLMSRLIDRPIRPLFAEGFRNEVQVINMVMSANPDFSAPITAMLGSSIALCISNISFEGPIAGVIVGRVDGKYIINPTTAELEASDLNVTVAGTEDAINMVEAGSKQVSEEDILEALMFGHEEIKRLVAFQKEIVKAVGKEKMEVELFQIPEDITSAVDAFAKEAMIKAISVHEKQARSEAMDAVEEKTVEHFTELWASDLESEREEKIKWVKMHGNYYCQRSAPFDTQEKFVRMDARQRNPSIVIASRFI